jgi:LCP family protein required for cell wall assembly
MVLLSVFLILTGFAIWEHSRLPGPPSDQDPSVLEYQGKEYVLKDGVETFLVLGLDKFQDSPSSDSYNNDNQADFLMLFAIDNDEKKISVLQINRDTMVDVNVLGLNGNKVSTVTEQIALAHTYGNGKDVSCRNTADSVSSLLLGMKVQHYISLKMDAVSAFNDLVGGVTLEVMDDFPNDPALKKGQTVTLTGEQALAYVRARQGMEDNSNVARMARQRQYVQALYHQVTNRMENDENFVVDASLQMKDYLVSDRSVTQMQQIADKFSTYEFVEIGTLRGESRVGEKFMEFYADADHVQEIVVQLFYELKN